MSLTGALESFPVVEVLRLVGRADKTGVLRVDAPGLEARIYLLGGGLTYGTTRRDEEFHTKLVEAGLVDPRAWVDIERRERTICDIVAEGKTSDELEEFLTDQLADVLFRTLRQTTGRFAFSEDVAPRFDTGLVLDIEKIVTEAQIRIERWREIEQVIPGTGFHLRLVGSPPDTQTITLTPEEWSTLTAFVGEGSVEEVAARLGWSDFRAAETMAGLVRRGLLDVSDLTPSARYAYGEETAPVAEPTHEIKIEGTEEPDRSAVTDTVSVDEDADGAPVDGDEKEQLRSAFSEIVSDRNDGSVLKRKRGLGAMVRQSEHEERGKQ